MPSAAELLAVLERYGVEAPVVAAIAANEVAAVVGNDTLCLHANDAYLDVIGYTRSELDTERVSWLRLTPVQFVAADLRGISEARAYGRSGAYEKEYARRDLTRRRILLVVEQLDTDPYLLLGVAARTDDARARAIVEGYARPTDGAG